MNSYNKLAPQLFNPQAHAKKHFDYAHFSYALVLFGLAVMGIYSLLGWV
jgi:hypothetical protein